MKTITVTDREYGLLRRAVEVQNDIMNDTVLETITSVNLYAREPIAVTPEQMIALRKELGEVADDLMAIRALMIKFNLPYNDDGYSA